VEIKAGPHAEEQVVKRAASHMDGIETKRKKAEKAGGGKTKKQKEIQDRLEEGLRRQAADARICDDFEEENEVGDAESGSNGDEEIENCLETIPEEDEEEEVEMPKTRRGKSTKQRQSSDGSDSDAPLLLRRGKLRS
jgi:hypothetical protein